MVGFTGVSCSTADVYRRLDELRAGGQASSRGIELSGEFHELATALARGDVGAAASLLGNDLEAAAVDLEPRLTPARDALRDAEPLAVVLAGSGSSWLALCAGEDDAHRVAGKAKASGALAGVAVASSLSHGPFSD